MTQGGLQEFQNISKIILNCDSFFELMLTKAKIACVLGRMFGNVDKQHVQINLNLNISMI